MTWLNPWAWLGLSALLLPVFIHLLTRTPANVQRFPTLRFIDVSRLPPRARKRIRDVVLLAVRIGILAAAVGALAQPVLMTEEIGARPLKVVRAIVLDTSQSMHRAVDGGLSSPSLVTVLDSATEVANALQREATTAVVVKTSNPAREIAGVVEWLALQSGKAEIAVVSDFQKGSIDSSTLVGVPAEVGVRLVRVAGAAMDSAFTLRTGERDSGVSIVASAYRTLIQWLPGQGPPGQGPPGEQEISSAVRLVHESDSGNAALMQLTTIPSAAWMADVLLSISNDVVVKDLANSGSFDPQDISLRVAADGEPTREAAPVVVVTAANGTPVVTAGADSATLVISMSAPPGSAAELALTRATARAMSLFPEMDERETGSIDIAQLAVWEREGVSQENNATALRALGGLDAADSSGRWLWLLALSLMLVEWLVRRSPPSDSKRTMSAT